MEKQKKKVLFVTQVGNFLQLFEMNDVKILQQMGYEVHYASNFESTSCQADTAYLESCGIKLHSIDIQRSPAAVFANFRAYRKLRKLLSKEQFHLLHCHAPMGGVLGRLVTLGQKKRPYVIYTAHGFHFYKGAPFYYWMIYFPVEYLLSRCTDCLITINREDYQRAFRFPLRKGGMAKRIPGVGLFVERYASRVPEREEIRQKFGLSEDCFYILSVGELNRNKNHQVLLHALALLKGEKLHLGICGEGVLRETLAELAKELGIAEQVTFFGYRYDIPEHLAAADCFAFPSFREGLGMAALEAMAAGLPVIASDCRGTREYMRHGENGFVCKSGTPEEYAQAILRLKEDEELRHRMSVQGRSMAEQFALPATDRMMRTIYKTYES